MLRDQTEQMSSFGSGFGTVTSASGQRPLDWMRPILHQPAFQLYIDLHLALVEVPLGNDFSGNTMNVIDNILSVLGHAKDGLRPNWSAIERVVHTFHMKDLWQKVRLPLHFLVKCEWLSLVELPRRH